MPVHPTQRPIARPNALPNARLVRRIETEHFVYCAWQRAPGRLCHVTVWPVSAAARYWCDSQGAPNLQCRARHSAISQVILELENRLRAYWGDSIDARRDW